MTRLSDEEYHARREREERERATNAADPAIGAIHAALADRHAELVRTPRRGAEPRRTLRLFGGQAPSA